MKNQKRNANKARNSITKGKSGDLLEKWRIDAANGESSPDTQEFLGNLDEQCDNGVTRDCLGKCGGNAVEANDGSCCEEHEIVGGTCFKDDDDPCPEGSVSDELGTCCEQSQLQEIGDGAGDRRTYICGGESQKYFGGKRADGTFGGYCYPESYDFEHPKDGFYDTGTFNSYRECTENNV